MTTLETRRYAQIPGVAMARAEAIPVASGELRIVPFEEWLTFVGRDVRRSESRYTRLAPVFYVDSSLLELDETGELVLDLFELPLVTRRLQLVLMLLSGWPLPDPAQSTGYVLLPEEGSRFRVPGARDIEWMVYPATETPLVIDGSMPIADVMSEIERLDAAGQGTELARLFDVFPLVFDGQLSHAELITHAVMSLEDVVNPDGKEPLGEVFAARLDLLSLGVPGESEFRQAFFGDYYRLRNRILHGGEAGEALRRISERLSEPADALRLAVEVLTDVARLLLGFAFDDAATAPSELLLGVLRDVDSGVLSRQAAVDLVNAVRFVP